MAEISPLILRLLEPLLASPLASLAADALTGLQELERSDRGADDLESQLRAVDEIVSGALKLELDLIVENRSMLSAMGDEQAIAPIVSVVVVRVDELGETRREDLLSLQRERNVLHLLTAWKNGVEAVSREADGENGVL